MADGRDLIDHLKQVKQHKQDGYWEDLNDAEKREWSSWVIHRFLSMSTDYLPLVNEVQRSLIGLDDHLVYQFWKNAIPSDPRFHNYIKADTKEGGTPDWLLEIIRGHFKVSNEEAREYLQIYTSSSKRREGLRELAHAYGIDQDKRDELEEYIDARSRRAR